MRFRIWMVFPAALTLMSLLTQLPMAPRVVADIVVTGTASENKRTPGISGPSSEVLKIVKAGVETNVVIAYIDSCSDLFGLSGDQILFLRNQGVSADVIASMLRHDAQRFKEILAKQKAEDERRAAEAKQQLNDDSAQDFDPNSLPPQAAPFYQELAPHGSWSYLDGSGWCWQPGNVATDPTWQPYLDNGQWTYTDYGWYWDSDYAWGWAPFHYGRWCNHASRGWVWFPDTVWAPSWVVWRQHDSYCGWAPLPPSPLPASGKFRHFNVNFDFNADQRDFAFVKFGDMFQRNLRACRLQANHVKDVFPKSKLVKNFSFRKGIVANTGIPVTQASQLADLTQIPTVPMSRTFVDPRLVSTPTVPQGKTMAAALKDLAPPTQPSVSRTAPRPHSTPGFTGQRGSPHSGGGGTRHK